MPETVLFYLSAIALSFCIYSASCYLFVKQNQITYIRVISIANVSYCVLTSGLMVYYFDLLKVLGLTYFTAEIAVICGLVYVELMVTADLQNL